MKLLEPPAVPAWHALSTTHACHSRPAHVQTSNLTPSALTRTTAGQNASPAKAANPHVVRMSAASCVLWYVGLPLPVLHTEPLIVPTLGVATARVLLGLNPSQAVAMGPAANASPVIPSRQVAQHRVHPLLHRHHHHQALHGHHLHDLLLRSKQQFLMSLPLPHRPQRRDLPHPQRLPRLLHPPQLLHLRHLLCCAHLPHLQEMLQQGPLHLTHLPQAHRLHPRRRHPQHRYNSQMVRMLSCNLTEVTHLVNL